VVQYASESDRQLLAERMIEARMSGVGNCYEKAVIESLLSSLKRELIHHTSYETPTDGLGAATLPVPTT
jgi:transposase InsO family protein